MHPFGPRARWCAALVAYALCAAFTLSPVWSTRVEPKWDGRNFNYPAFAYAAETIKAGRLPLWNPYTNCGEPFISDPAYLWYQPGAVAAALLRTSSFEGYMLFWAGIWAWSGYGAFLLAAVLGAGPLGSFVAAVSFSFSGFFVGHGQHVPYVVTAAWFPWVLALAHAAVLRRSRPLALLAGVSLGLSALGGYAGLVIFECLALVLWLSLAFLGARSELDTIELPWKTRAAWVVGVLAVAAVLLVLIWSPSLYAFLEEARDFTDRTRPVSDSLALYGNPFPLTAAVSFVFPQLVVERHTLFPSDVSMINAYLGALALPFALVGLVSGGRRRWWVLVFAGFWFWMPLGGTAGLRTVLHHVAPATRFMRHNGMLRILFLAPLAAMAGVGVTAAFSGRLSHGSRIAWGWLAAISAMAVATTALLGSGERGLRAVAPSVLAASGAVAVCAYTRRRGLAGAAAATAIAAIFTVDLAWHTRTNSFTAWQDPQAELSLREVERHGRNFDPLMPRRTDPVFHGSKLNLVNRFPVVEGYVALRSSVFDQLVQDRFFHVLARQRYWLSPSAWSAPDRETGVAALAPLGPTDPIPVLVEDRKDVLAESPVVPGTFGTVRVTSYAPERVEVSVDVPGTSDAILASTERISPSWQVHVDGERRDLSVVNYFFRGVRVPPGRHDIVFRYEPRVFIVLLVLGYGTIAVTLSLAFWIWRRDRASPSMVMHGSLATCSSAGDEPADAVALTGGARAPR